MPIIIKKKKKINTHQVRRFADERETMYPTAIVRLETYGRKCYVSTDFTSTVR